MRGKPYNMAGAEVVSRIHVACCVDAVVLSDSLVSQKPGIPGSSNSWQPQWPHLPTQHNTSVPSTTTVFLQSLFLFGCTKKKQLFSSEEIAG